MGCFLTRYAPLDPHESAMRRAKGLRCRLVYQNSRPRSLKYVPGGVPCAMKASVLEFMQRLAALVQRHRLHLIRFHGVLLAPNAKLRALVVPQGREQPGQSTEVATATECEADRYYLTRAGRSVIAAFEYLTTFAIVPAMTRA